MLRLSIMLHRSIMLRLSITPHRSIMLRLSITPHRSIMLRLSTTLHRSIMLRQQDVQLARCAERFTIVMDKVVALVLKDAIDFKDITHRALV
jgi:hypothetical protein